jgi:cytochrome bd-type quinol oxidase subunit 2
VGTIVGVGVAGTGVDVTNGIDVGVGVVLIFVKQQMKEKL